MTFFRLFNLNTLEIENCDLDQHPPYIAASHAWIDDSFGCRKDGFNDCFGGKGIRKVVDQVYPDVHYCWVDRFCIDQQDKNDKLRQIPLMERIFSQAEAVVVFLKTRIGADQAKVNELASELQGAVEMCQDEAWEESGHYWQYEEGRGHIVRAMNGLQRLASTVWATRVWTMQEYVLAKSIIWIGLELEPIRLEDIILTAIPDVCDTLAIEECFNPQMQLVFGNLSGMANVRLRKIDRTRVMELLGNRRTKKPVDEVFGSMSASGVIINPIMGESKLAAWRRWCETAVTQGHIRWILLPTNGRQVEDGEDANCLMPYFSGRHLLSASSGLDHVAPLGPVVISDGCVTVAARRLGKLKILRRLGIVHQDRNLKLMRDITLILFGQGKRHLSLRIVSAFGGGRYNAEQAEAIACVLVRNYIPASAYVLNGNEVDFRPSLRGELQRIVWPDFMALQHSQMIGLNEGTGYLCQILQDLTNEPLITVLVCGESIPDNLEALDLGARDSSGRAVFMVISSDKRGEGSIHKVGMTLPVSDDFDALWVQLPLVTVSIGGKNCHYCKASQNGREAKKSVAIKSDNPRTGSRARKYAMRALRRQSAVLMRQNPKAQRSSELIFRRKSKRIVHARKLGRKHSKSVI